VSIDAQADHQAEADPRPPVDLELELGGFDGFFTREYPRLVTLLTAVTGRRAVAEEIAQEAMLRAQTSPPATVEVTPTPPPSGPVAAETPASTGTVSAPTPSHHL